MQLMSATQTNLTIYSLLSLPRDKQQTFLKKLKKEDKAALLHSWLFWARPKQLIPDELLTEQVSPFEYRYNTWLILAGRGFGKTRTGAEAVKWLVEKCGYRSIALVGRTAADVRSVMVQGPSGLLSVFPEWNQPKYEPSKRMLTFPNGAIATTYSADKPDQLRGPNTDLVWGDELAAWRFDDAFDQVQFGNRIGKHPLQIYTTTPRPTQIIRNLAAPSSDAYVTFGNTFENELNLAPSALRKLKEKYEGTRLGRQELYAAILDDVPGALWTRAMLDAAQVKEFPAFKRVVVAIDPAITSNEETSDETGIIVAGLGVDDKGYVLEDKSGIYTPNDWARVALGLYDDYRAERIVAEKNQGGDMVENTLRTFNGSVSFKGIHAKRGKTTRAEPVSALYEQGRVKHYGRLAELEDQMCTWVQGDKDSPDRMDALVYAITELMIDKPATISAYENPFYQESKAL